jgi:hypothetical protein
MAGDKDIWITPVPAIPWFGGKNAKQLPAPVTSRQKNKDRSTSSRPVVLTDAPQRKRRADIEKQQEQKQSPTELAKPSYIRAVDEHYVWVPRQRDGPTEHTVRLDAPSRDNTRSTNASRRTYDNRDKDNEKQLSAPAMRMTRSTSRDRDPPSRNNTRSTNATRTTVDGGNRNRDRERGLDRPPGVRAPPSAFAGLRDADPPSRNNTRSTNATRTTVESRDRDRNTRGAATQLERTRSGNNSSRKPDYYRRDLSPKR